MIDLVFLIFPTAGILIPGEGLRLPQFLFSCMCVRRGRGAPWWTRRGAPGGASCWGCGGVDPGVGGAGVAGRPRGAGSRTITPGEGSHRLYDLPLTPGQVRVLQKLWFPALLIMLAKTLAKIKIGLGRLPNPFISLEPARGVEPRAC